MRPFPLLLLGWLVVLTPAAFAQTTTLTGRVIDATTGQPLPFATVYIDGTTRGTLTDDAGEYRLAGVPLGSVTVAVSYVGYQTGKLPLRLTGGPRRIPLAIRPDAAQLQAVTVKGKKPRSWQRQYRQFRAALLGESAFANQCEIANGNLVDFSEKDGHLLATAPEPLVIENKALGYRLHYELLHFDFYRKATYYAGVSRFEELTPESPAQAARWRRARQRAYEGSTQHLLASLLTGTHERAGFLVYQATFSVPDDAHRVVLRTERDLGPRVVGTDTLFRPGELPFERELVLPVCLEIFNTRQRGRNSPYPELPYAYTVLYLPEGSTVITTGGWVIYPKGLEMRGHLGGDRLATLLPSDWVPEGAEPPAPALAQSPGASAPDARLDSLVARETPPSGEPLVFVLPDKPLYTTGDRLHLSAWLLDPMTQLLLPNRVGGAERNPVLHIELLTANGQRVLHQVQPVDEGRAVGDFRLSDSLQTGTYRLRAYPEPSRNEERPAFERTIRVQTGLKAPGFAPSPLPLADSPDVQVLPEGGRWVAGLPARLGLKALDRWGRGLPTSVAILDERGAEIARTQTNALGMGSVTVTPAPHQRYRAEARWGAVSQPIALPQPEPTGLVLNADALSDSTRIRVRVRATAGHEGQPVYVLVKSRGRVQARLGLVVKNGATEGAIPALALPPGVAEVTLFDAAGHPRAERLVFVPEGVVPPTLALTPGKTRYEPREWAAFALRLTDGADQPLVIAGSVAVTDADQVPGDSTEADLRTHLLLTHALRGRVENPNFYFRKTDPATRRALDDLLLTQGWRRMTRSPAEADSLGGLALQGRVLNRRGQPLADARVLLTSTDPRQPVGFSARTDSAGRFRLSGLNFRDTLRLRYRVMDSGFKAIAGATVQLEPAGVVFSEKPVPIPDWAPTPAAWETARQHQETDLDAYRERDARQLTGVTVRAAKPQSEEEEAARRTSIHGTPDAAIDFDESAGPYRTVFDMLGAYGPNVKRKGNSTLNRGVMVMQGGSQAPLYLLDGVYVDAAVLEEVNPGTIARIEILKNSEAAIYGSRGAGGVIAFFTRKGSRNVAGPPVPELTAYGFPTQREFYLPRYGLPDETPVKTDRRDVLFWNPRLVTSEQGQATIRFPLSDAVRTLRIVVQGVSAEGEPVAVERLVRVR